MNIVHALNEKQIENIRLVFREYYAELLKLDTTVEEFEKELSDLPGAYASPDGALLLALDGQRTAGCVALKKIDDEICEMKRLFIRSDYRGQGWGRQLADKIVEEARARAYSTLRLDTLETLDAANSLYQSMGFRQITPYAQNTKIELVYWGLDLYI